MSWVMVGVAAVGAAVKIGEAVSQNKKAKKEKKRKKKYKKAMAEFEKNRQPVINQADKIRAMKDQVSNPMANLPVATQAAEMQMAQTDQALANTLDTIKSTGGGAGGATALAQAAAQSKAKVSAGIEQQEASNQKAAAQGEATKQKQLMDIESAALSEEVAAYGRQDTRDIVQLNRMQSQIEGAEANQRAYEQAAGEAVGDAVGGAGTALTGLGG